MKSFAKICLVLLTAATLAAFTTQAQTDAASSSTNKPATAPAKPKGKAYRGRIASVDSAAKTITITLASGASQTIQITSRTRIRKDGQPATLADAAAGLKVSGTEREDDSGNWVATTVNIGEPRPRSSATTTNAPPAAANKQ